MFKKGEFIRDKDCSNSVIYKVMKITYDLGHNRIYILRPKGLRNDWYDEEYATNYVNSNFRSAKKTKVTLEEALALIAKGAFSGE